MKYRRIVYLIFFCLFWLHASGYCQNVIKKSSVRKLDDQILVSLSTSEHFSYEVIPFESRVYTLIKLWPVQFQMEAKEAFDSTLKTLSVMTHVLELSDSTIMLSFKGISAEQLKIKTNDLPNKIDILIRPTLLAQTLVKKNTNIDQAKEYYLSACNHFKDSHYSDAITAIHKSLKLHPNYAEAYFLAGEVRFQLGQWNKARINFNIAKKLNPKIENIQPYMVKIEQKLNPKLSQKMPHLNDKKEKENFDQEIQYVPEQEESTKEIIQKDTSFKSDRFNDTVLPQNETGISVSDTSTKINSVPQSEKQSAIQNNHATYSLQKPGKNYFQFGFFLLIVCSILSWGILIWRKKNHFKQFGKEQTVDFDKTLHELQKRLHKVGNDMPEMKKKPRIDQLQGDMTKPIIKTVIKSGKKEIPKEVKKADYKSNSKEKRIVDLASIGYSVEEIAKKMHLGKGEVQLTLQYSGRQAPSTVPDLRIEMD